MNASADPGNKFFLAAASIVGCVVELVVEKTNTHTIWRILHLSDTTTVGVECMQRPTTVLFVHAYGGRIRTDSVGTTAKTKETAVTTTPVGITYFHMKRYNTIDPYLRLGLLSIQDRMPR